MVKIPGTLKGKEAVEGLRIDSLFLEKSRCELAVLGDPDALRAWPLGTLSRVERHGLAFPKLVELTIRTRRLMEEILVAIGRRHKPKTLFTH